MLGGRLEKRKAQCCFSVGPEVGGHIVEDVVKRIKTAGHQGSGKSVEGYKQRGDMDLSWAWMEWGPDR